MKKNVLPMQKMIAFEQCRLSDVDTVDLFQQLIDSGAAWTLQGMYGRIAQQFIQSWRLPSRSHIGL